MEHIKIELPIKWYEAIHISFVFEKRNSIET